MLPLLQRLTLMLLALVTCAASNEDILEVVSALAPAFSLSSIQIVCDTNHLGGFKSVKKWITSAPITSKVTVMVDNNIKSLREQNVVYCIDDTNQDGFLEAHSETSHQGTHHKWFAVGNRSSIDQLIRRSNILIDQAVYFVTTDTNFVIESYTIGEARVKTTIGYMFRHLKSRLLYYKAGQGVEESFMERRSNFKGQALTALTAGQLPFLAIPGFNEAYASKEGWYKNSNGVEVKDMNGMPMGGLFYDVLKILETNVNFTSKMQMAKSDSFTFGEPVNGTWNGLIGRTMRGEFDFLNGPVTQSDRRFEVVDFALPFGTETIAFYIPTKSLERREWLSFLYPLRAEVWTCLLFNSLLLLLALKLFELFYSGKSFMQGNPFVLITDAAGDLWMLGASYFGRKPVRQSTSRERAIRVLLVFAFLSGNIVFMSYRASLTAELSVRREALPFNNLDELRESDYKILHIKNIAAWFAFYGESEAPLHRLYNDKIIPQNDEGGFTSPVEGLDLMLAAEEPTTFFYIKEAMIYLKDYHCLITKVVESRQPNLLSFAFPKNSPYLKFIDYHLLKLMEQGTMSLLQKKYLDIDIDCRDDDQDVSLSFVKLVSLFAILGTGVVSSIILFACEIFFKDRYKDHTSNSKPDLEMSGGNEADLIEPPYDDRLKKFMFKWGVSNRSAFLLDFEQLLRLKHAERGGNESVSILNGYSSVNSASRHGSAATTTTNMGTGISRSPMPLRMSQRFIYRHNGISKS